MIVINFLWRVPNRGAQHRGLDGRSDADGVAHAMVDALLSASGLGDIGTRFGTPDPAWESASGVAAIASALIVPA